MTIAKLTAVVEVVGAKAVQDDLEKTAGKITKVSSAAEKMTTAMGIAGAATAAYALGRSALDAAARMEALQQALKANTSGTQELQAVTKDLAAIAKLPAINLEQAYMGFIQLKAAKLSTKEAEDGLRGIAKAAAAVAATPDQFGRAINGLQQIANSTKPLQEDINILREALPNAAMLLDKAFGTSRAEEIAKLGMSGKQVALRFMEIANTVPAVEGGIGNMVVNLQDSFREMNESIGRLVAKFLEAFGPRIQEAMGKVSELFDRLAKNGNTVDKVLRLAFGFMVGSVVVGAIKNVAAITEAFIVLRKAIQSVAAAEIVAMAIASPGKAVAAIGAALAIGAGATFGMNKMFDALFGKTTSAPAVAMPSPTMTASIPSIPSIASSAMTSSGSTGKGSVSLIRTLAGMTAQLINSPPPTEGNRIADILDNIEANTKTTSEVLQLRKQSIGGGALFGLGVTAREQRVGVAGALSSMGSSSVMGGTQIERQIRRVVMDEIRRTGGYGIPRG